MIQILVFKLNKIKLNETVTNEKLISDIVLNVALNISVVLARWIHEWISAATGWAPWMSYIAFRVYFIVCIYIYILLQWQIAAQ